MMIGIVSPVMITIPQWARAIGSPIQTVRGWQARYPDFPVASQVITSTLHLYRRSDLDRWLAKHPTLGRGRGEWNKRDSST